MHYHCRYYSVLASFCVFSVVRGGLLGLTHGGYVQHNLDLSSVTSALSGGLQKVFDVIKNPKPITIEIYSQEQPTQNEYQHDNGNHFGQMHHDNGNHFGQMHQGKPQYQGPPQYQETPQYQEKPQHHNHGHHHHDQRPPDRYPNPPPPPPPQGQGHPPQNPQYTGMGDYYPNGNPQYTGMGSYYPNGNQNNDQHNGQNQHYRPGGDAPNRNDDSGTDMRGNEVNNGEGNSQDTGPVWDNNEESGIRAYIDGFPVIPLEENDIRR